MESRAPAVVAVVVTTGPGPGLEATLASLAAQDYPALSLLVLANGEGEGVASRVAAVAPTAFVRVLEENRGFGAACNEAALMVEGTAFFLFCHDDVRLNFDVASVMVEAAFRTNAGIVTPKVVAYEDPLVLLHVGQTCDRFGVVQERVELGEIDHGQQDLERDVFVAPGGVTLVRADLFATLRGYDPLIPALGEDLDLCWRAQVAGARIVVAPAAKVAHRETILTGERVVSASGTRRASRQDLLRRHQLLVVATGWGRRYTVSTLALLFVMDTMEFALALVGRDTDRAGAILGSWRWLLFHRRRVRDRRRQRRVVQALADADLRRLQVGGAHRLKRFFVILVREGLDAARGILPDGEDETPPDVEESDAGVGFAAAFSESEEFDEIAQSEGLGRRHPARFLASFRSQALVIIGVAVLWGIGSRNLVAMHLPLIGRLAPLDSWWTTWRHYFASWSANGVGTGAPGAPGYGVLGFAGSFVFGRMGVLPRLALIFAAPVGAIGVARLLKGRVSNRARVVGALAYLAAPVGLNMIGQGRTDVLTVVAGLPFVVRRLFDLLEVPGFPAAPYRDPVPFAHRGWRASAAGQRAIAAMLVAVLAAMAPATVVLVVLVVAGVALARLVEPDEDVVARTWRPLARLLVGVAVLLAPLTLDTVLAGRRALEVVGLARGPWSVPGFADLARGADGRFGATWLGYLVPAAALLAYAITRAERRRIATKFLAIAGVTLAVAALSSRHWLGPVAPNLDVLLALYVLALAALVGLGVSALELDLRQAGFGWRQAAAGAVIAALVVSVVPFTASLASGRFDLPTTSTAESLSALAPPGVNAYRVLWLADPAVAPMAGWSVAPGLEAATSTDGLPGGTTLFSSPDAGTTNVILRAVDLALTGRTVRLGALLATAGISSIVVMNSAAPGVAGVTVAPTRAVAGALVAALARQTDLGLELQTASVEVYANSLFHGLVASRASGAWTPLAGSLFAASSAPRGGLVVAGLAPASAFTLRAAPSPVSRATTDGWAPSFTLAPASASASASAQPVRLVMDRFPWNGLLAGATLLVWLTLGLGFSGVRRVEGLAGRARRATRRPRGRHARSARG